MSMILQANVAVQENVRLADRTWRLRFHYPDLAQIIRPGQFLMVRLPGVSDPLLGRPFALYDTVLNSQNVPTEVDIVYLVIGRMTGLLSHLQSGDQITVWGPLGNGFGIEKPVSHVGLVAGGIGQTPFLAYTRELLGERGYGGDAPQKSADRVTIYYGARSSSLLAGVDDFRNAGAEVEIATDDGTDGYHGRVTELLANVSRPDHLVGCGPEPMLKDLTQRAAGWQIPCQVSLETPMACGVGVCFSCVVPIKTDAGWDYRRVCVEGPVFDAEQIQW